MIALMGLDAETGVFMLLFLDLAYEDAKRQGRLRSLAELNEAIVHGAVKRVRPKLMTVTAAFMGLMPIMWSTGAGSDQGSVTVPAAGCGRDEAGRRPDGRRPRHILPARAPRLPGDLPALALAHGGEAPGGCEGRGGDRRLAGDEGWRRRSRWRRSRRSCSGRRRPQVERVFPLRGDLRCRGDGDDPGFR